MTKPSRQRKSVRAVAEPMAQVAPGLDTEADMDGAASARAVAGAADVAPGALEVPEREGATGDTTAGPAACVAGTSAAEQVSISTAAEVMTDAPADAPDGEGLEAVLSRGGDDDPVAVLALAGAFMARQVAALIDRADRDGGLLDRPRVEALGALARMMERWETLATERAKDDDASDERRLADAYRRIDDRIIELAEAEAARLVAARDRA